MYEPYHTNDIILLATCIEALQDMYREIRKIPGKKEIDIKYKREKKYGKEEYKMEKEHNRKS